MYQDYITQNVESWYGDFCTGKSEVFGDSKQFKCFDILPNDTINIGYDMFTFVIESGISCSFKCDKENNNQLCQNFALTKQQLVTTSIDKLISMYLS